MQPVTPVRAYLRISLGSMTRSEHDKIDDSPSAAFLAFERSNNNASARELAAGEAAYMYHTNVKRRL
jgi:hypothetical protein